MASMSFAPVSWLAGSGTTLAGGGDLCRCPHHTASSDCGLALSADNLRQLGALTRAVGTYYSGQRCANDETGYVVRKTCSSFHIDPDLLPAWTLLSRSLLAFVPTDMSVTPQLDGCWVTI